MFTYAPPSGRFKGGFLVPSPDNLKVVHTIGTLTGVSTTNGITRVPLDARLYEYLTEKLQIEPDIIAKKWHDFEVSGEQAFYNLLSGTDAILRHSQALRLRPYQRIGAAFIYRRRRCLVCDACGTGKTAETVIAIQESRHDSRILVVCPNSVKLQWRAEIFKWSAQGTDTPVTVLDWEAREEILPTFDKGWLIMNYHNFRAYSRVDAEKVEAVQGRNTAYCTLLPGEWDWVVFDEGHNLKNRKTIGYSVARNLKARNMAILTGTPMGNDVSEVWSLLNLIDPERYSSYWRFYGFYVSYTEDFFGKRTINGPKNEDLLRRELSTRMIRRTKAEVAPDLPPVTTQRIELEMSVLQRTMYKRALADWLIELGDGSEELEIAAPIAMIVRLRQILSTPFNFGQRDSSCKTEACLELIEGTDQHIVVFTVFRKTAQAIVARLKQAGIHGGLIMGGVDTEERDRVVQALNKGEIQVVVCTIKAGGTGLNLQAASIGIFLDKEWNPLEQQQAEDRLLRIGQSLPVTIYHLVCPDTVDDLVEGVLERKVEMTNAVLQDSLLIEAAKYLALPPRLLAESLPDPKDVLLHSG